MKDRVISTVVVLPYSPMSLRYRKRRSSRSLFLNLSGAHCLLISRVQTSWILDLALGEADRWLWHLDPVEH
jgi:hypothetical protein